MVTENINNKLPLIGIFGGAWRYCATHVRAMMLFAILNYIVCVAAFYSWKTVWFWSVLVAMYILWGALFRYYFRREPYVDVKSLFASMIPSTKILVFSVLVVSAILLLPIGLLFVPGLPAEFMNGYSVFLSQTMHESDVMDMVVNLVVIILSPYILYRPMLAWIAAILGRSGSLKFAWEKTKGNYWEFLLLAVVVDLCLAAIYNGILMLGGNVFVALLPISVLVIYFNIVLAKIYAFFFLEVNKKGA